jgi:hypothetical protein
MTAVSQSAEPPVTNDYQSFIAIQPSGIPLRVISGASRRNAGTASWPGLRGQLQNCAELVASRAG